KPMCTATVPQFPNSHKSDTLRRRMTATKLKSLKPFPSRTCLMGDQEKRIPLGGMDVKAARITYVTLAWAFVACIAVQVFLAGMGVFVSPRYFQSHTGFVHLFEWIPVVMFITAFPGRLSPRLRWMTAGLWALIAV